MSTPRRLALIGVGGHGSHHMFVIRHLETLGKVKLTAVADPFVDSLPEEKARLDAAGVVWYQDYRDLLTKEKDLGGIVISTPIHLHESMLREALEQTQAAILLEKPAFPTVRQLKPFLKRNDLDRVRVGFQMIHWPDVQALKQLLCSGQMGAIRRITLSAGWPRLTSYYERAGWAGKMTHHGKPVFDGPATNALAHLLHNAMYFAGAGPTAFATPMSMTGEFYRSRAIDSYDFAWLQADLGGIELNAALAHCVGEVTPFRMQIETGHGIVALQESPPTLVAPPAFALSPTKTPSPAKLPMYASWLDLDDAPTTLRDTLGHTALACGGLLSSDGIHAVPEPYVSRDSTSEDVVGLTEYLRQFMDNPLSPSEHGFPWAQPSQPVENSHAATLDLSDAGLQKNLC